MPTKKEILSKMSASELKKLMAWKCPLKGHGSHSGLEHFSCYTKLHKIDLGEKIGFFDVECLVPGSLILTNKGLKPIEKIKIGEKVLTHQNRWEKVTKVFEREYNGKVCEMGYISFLPMLTLTPNHPILLANELHKKNRSLESLKTQWKKIEEMKPNDLTISIKNEDAWVDIPFIEIGEKPKADHHNTSDIPNKLIIDDDFLTVIGLFLGDGSATSTTTIEFFPNIKDKEFLDILKRWAQKIGAKNISIVKQGWMYKVSISSLRLYKFFRLFYNENKEKCLPLQWLNLPTDRFLNIVKGFYLSDGCVRKFPNRIDKTIYNTSINLLKDICIRLSFSNIRFIMDSIRKNPQITKIRGKEYKVKPCFRLRYNLENDPFKSNSQWDLIEYIFRRNKVYHQKTYKGKVYNLEVENGKSYIANGIVVHNCEDLKSDFGILFCWKILENGTNKMYGDVLTLDDIKKGKSTKRDVQPKEDRRIVQSLVDTLGKFDRVIAHYGSRFDLPMVRSRAVICDVEFPPYGALYQGDTWQILKNKFKLSRNSLQNATLKLLGITRKDHLSLAIKHGCLRGEKWALDLTEKHCENDVLDLRDLYNKISFAVKINKSSI